MGNDYSTVKLCAGAYVHVMMYWYFIDILLLVIQIALYIDFKSINILYLSHYLSLSLAAAGYQFPGGSVPATVYYDGGGLAGGSNVFYSPYNGPIMYTAPILSVDDGTLKDYIKKQM